eukprot:TRINITY_DN3725_c0_g1_i1.p1 TRINITY_DN3725_c0_g1~~TRINITY_DN3725_c0_g1_i1.p1  ORF type:complete len:241 (-),score=55.52 TRINITY_DN3725_c0_g1_i1:285-944(-)
MFARYSFRCALALTRSSSKDVNKVLPILKHNYLSFQQTTTKSLLFSLQKRGYCTSTTDHNHNDNHGNINNHNQSKTEETATSSTTSVNPSSHHHEHEHDHSSCEHHHHEHHRHYHINDIKPEERMYIEFNCGVCDFRVKKTFSKHSYEKGVVIIRCDECRKLHLIADHLGFTGFGGERTIEEILQAKGEPYARIRVEPKLEVKVEEPKVETTNQPKTDS